MAIEIGDVSTGILPPDSGQTLTIEHEVSGTNKILVVGVDWDNDDYEVVTGVTWNGTLLAHVVSIERDDDARAEIWSLVAPEDGTYDVVITFDAAPRRDSIAGAITFTGVDQTTPLGDTSAYQGDPYPDVDIDVDSSVGDVIFATAAIEWETFPDVGTGQTAHWLLQSGLTGAGGTTKPGEDTSTNMLFTMSGDDHVAMVGVAIKPAVAAYYHGLKVQGEGELALCDVGSHPLRIRKGGTTYGIELVATDDPNASRIRIKTGAGIKAIRKYT